MRRLVSTAAAAAVAMLGSALLVAPDACAATRGLAGRVFSIGELGVDVSPYGDYRSGDTLAVGGDGTVWIAQHQRLWRLLPSRTVVEQVWPPSRSWKEGERELGGSVSADDNGRLLVVANRSGPSPSGGWFTWWEVLRRSPSGRLTRIAGQEASQSAPSGVDGAPAVAVTLCAPRVTALPGGAFALADDSGWVRRVDARGAISTIFPTPPVAGAPFGCPIGLTGDRLPVLAGMPDGGVIILSRYGKGKAQALSRVAPDGAISTLSQGHRDIKTIASAADGSLLIVQRTEGAYRLLRRAPGSRQSTVVIAAHSQDEMPFGREGALASHYTTGDVTDVASTPDGGIVALVHPEWASAGSDLVDRVVYVAPLHPRRLAVALDPRAGRATTAAYRARFRVTRKSLVRLVIRDARGKLIGVKKISAQAGLNTVAFRRTLPTASYLVSLDARGKGGQRAVHTTRLVLGGRLTRSYVRSHFVPEKVGGCGGSNGDCWDSPVHLDGCRAFTPRRIDCRYRWSYRRSDPAECELVSIRLTDVGTLKGTILRQCPKGLRFPVRLRPTQDERFKEWVPTLACEKPRHTDPGDCYWESSPFRR